MIDYHVIQHQKISINSVADISSGYSQFLPVTRNGLSLLYEGLSQLSRIV